MNPLIFSINAVFPLILVAAFGFYARKTNTLTEDFLNAGNKFCFKYGFFFMMFTTIYDIESFDEIIDGSAITFEKYDETIDNVIDTTKTVNKENELAKAFSLVTSELKENLNEVTRQKRQIETILLHMTDGIIAFDLEGEVTHKNLAATRLLNIEENDNNFDKIFSKYSVDINLEKIIYLEDWTSSDKRINVDDKFINLLFVTYKDNNQRPAGVIAVVQDITEHVKLDNMRKEFVADVSHELKTPITSIMGYADTLLEEEYDKETQSKFLSVIASEARRMAKLVTDLLTLSKNDNKRNVAQKEMFDLGELVKKCQDKLAIEIKKKNHEVKCFVTADVPLVYADKDRIAQVIHNIVDNALKYVDEKDNLTIRTILLHDNRVSVEIENSGEPIAQKDKPHIFDRFYMAEKAHTSGNSAPAPHHAGKHPWYSSRPGRCRRKYQPAAGD